MRVNCHLQLRYSGCNDSDGLPIPLKISQTSPQWHCKWDWSVKLICCDDWAFDFLLIEHLVSNRTAHPSQFMISHYKTSPDLFPMRAELIPVPCNHWAVFRLQAILLPFDLFPLIRSFVNISGWCKHQNHSIGSFIVTCIFYMEGHRKSMKVCMETEFTLSWICHQFFSIKINDGSLKKPQLVHTH